ncbi:MAG: DegT/DnrJ/EryC1/StrS family aminotransferase [Elusimicrobiaceae bacterium]|jgi:dTDP-4-amino-4,6-dideoxygalactose transaminase|nr:DegT/DnrJ/EryC1/StrS family aminotransferase [Elusimicrobiaceae bacterium]MBT3954775.1 DegT/DnrJ/EryC1/StrS family aminotransferase [Elusimicrobiaceae bacterium]MBT4008710.1 DegT/DnrJ/EryC1/StrS family aminotransferase [Elusimicrobiaceae bacterium]MBT4403341.1 DegT/DnrJ/EryC1/StrS family aminotransferase [Elusimicrobiaceae bacterium]MBT4439828.1 DegT/DnrJ/EryC1/StrS family aminotransferase [Elusimicrobiaceae bacterium]
MTNERNIPLFNLQKQFDSLKPELESACLKALGSMKWLLGPETKEFEKEFAEIMGAKHCISCSSGASAIQIALMAAGIGKGDEVITTPFTFVATTTSITLTGADIVFADIEPETYNIDPKKIEEKITSKTKAILPVHLYGYPANMDGIMEVAKKHNLIVIEDCAQSHLSKYKGKTTGTIGLAGSFSFYPSKNLGACGDAGAIITDDDSLADKCSRIRHSGRSNKPYEYDYEGSTLRADEIQTAMLRVKLRHLKTWTEMRNNAAQMYNKYLKDISQIKTPKNCEDGSTQSFYVYTIFAEKRDELSKFLTENKIGNSIYYPKALYDQPIYKYMGLSSKDFPETDLACKSVLALPMYPEISEEEIKIIADVIKSFYG